MLSVAPAKAYRGENKYGQEPEENASEGHLRTIEGRCRKIGEIADPVHHDGGPVAEVPGGAPRWISRVVKHHISYQFCTDDAPLIISVANLVELQIFLAACLAPSLRKFPFILFSRLIGI